MNNQNEIKKILEKLTLEQKEYFSINTTDQNLLKELSKDDNWKIRYNVASNPNCPKDIFDRLYKDDNRVVRAYVSRKCTEKDILEELSKDDAWNVRCGVAKNQNCPIHILEKLSKDEDV